MLRIARFETNLHRGKGGAGVNGAGKTSTFRVLTGENRATAGDAFIGGCSVHSEWREVRL